MIRPYSFAFLIVAFLIIFISPLFTADLVATYEVEPFYVIENNSTGYEQGDYRVAFKLGTITINSSGNPTNLKKLTLDRNNNVRKEEYTFKTTEKVGGENSFAAELVAKITYANGTNVVHIKDTKGIKLLEKKDNPYPIFIEFFMVIESENLNSSHFQGVGFQFSGNQSIGWFQLTFESKSKSDPKYIFPSDSGAFQPFFNTIYNVGSGNYINPVDITRHLVFEILQLENEKSINLIDAIGTFKAKVGTAKITVEGNYSPNIGVSFTGEHGSPNGNFRLKHKEVESYIPYSLFFGNPPLQVESGPFMTWGQIVLGENLKNLHVGNIDHQLAAASIAGEYSETITVTITPVDSNPISP